MVFVWYKELKSLVVELSASAFGLVDYSDLSIDNSGYHAQPHPIITCCHTFLMLVTLSFTWPAAFHLWYQFVQHFIIFFFGNDNTLNFHFNSFFYFLPQLIQKCSQPCLRNSAHVTSYPSEYWPKTTEDIVSTEINNVGEKQPTLYTLINKSISYKCSYSAFNKYKAYNIVVESFPWFWLFQKSLY